MYDGAIAMGEPKTPAASLLPSGQGLDLFVTLTDYHGYRQLMQIHDPPLIYELEHRHVLHFKYRRGPGGEVESDFDLDNVPALAFAARATSSFPGAFPPAQIVEMDELVASRGARWPRREEFILGNFERYLRADIDPATAPSSTAPYSTTARSGKRFRRSTAVPPIAMSTDGWSLSMPIRHRWRPALAASCQAFSRL
jgi:hypothetical protein